MFEQADISLIEIRLKLETLRSATITETFTRSFMDVMDAAGKGLRAILEADRARLPKGFAQWLEARSVETAADELLRIALEPGDSFGERGENRLLFALEVSPPVVAGTPTEEMPNGWWTSPGVEKFHAALRRRPRRFRGVELLQNDPVSVCRIISNYLSELADEAQARLAEASRADHSLLFRG